MAARRGTKIGELCTGVGASVETDDEPRRSDAGASDALLVVWAFILWWLWLWLPPLLLPPLILSSNSP